MAAVDGVAYARSNTYMNTSGEAVGPLAALLGVPPERVVVVHDELDLDFGVLRLKQGGGDNGHNGLRSLTRSLGGPDYLRRFAVERVVTVNTAASGGNAALLAMEEAPR